MPGRYSDTPEDDRRPPRDRRPADPEPAPDADPWVHGEDLGEPDLAEAVGDTVDEAIQNALDILGAQEDEVEIEVLEVGQRGFLGFGKRRPFRVRATWIEDLDDETLEEEIPDVPPPRAPRVPAPAHAPRAAAAPTPPASAAQALSTSPRAAAPRRPAAVPAPPSSPPDSGYPADLDRLAQRARDVTDDLLRRMGMVATITVTTARDEIKLAIESDEDDSLLIGRRGETRAAIEHLVQRLAIPREEREILVHVDINGYWQRRVERLRSEALELAAEAIRDGQEIRTEPLSAQERRIVHRALVDDERVSTESIGTGALKRVAIIPIVNR
jgi:spoIIIJ-associated protein